MKKRVFNRVVLAMVMVAALCSMIGSAFAASTDDLTSSGAIVSPRYAAVRSLHVTLSFSGSQANCKAYATLYDNYTANTFMCLQKLDGGWQTIQEWSTDGSMCSKKFYVSHGTYRVEGTVNVYDSRGNYVETITDYSDTVSY